MKTFRVYAYNATFNIEGPAFISANEQMAKQQFRHLCRLHGALAPVPIDDGFIAVCDNGEDMVFFDIKEKP